jgi:hypothetical protein
VISDIIAAHLKMLLSFEKYFPEHADPRRKNMWIVNPFVEHKETALTHEETLRLFDILDKNENKKISKFT